jgi:hypothetical protein
MVGGRVCSVTVLGTTTPVAILKFTFTGRTLTLLIADAILVRCVSLMSTLSDVEARSRVEVCDREVCASWRRS